jgi:hypothetical protein
VKQQRYRPYAVTVDGQQLLKHPAPGDQLLVRTFRLDGGRVQIDAIEVPQP